VTPTPSEEPQRRARPAGPAGRAWSRMQQFVDSHNRHGDLAEALGFRLGAGRGRILFQLRHGPLTLSQLAEANGFDAPYTTLVVDKLEAHGLVERHAHPDDRRRKLITLTTSGQDAIATADAILLRPPRVMKTLSAAELRQLSALLDRLIAADDLRAGDPLRRPG
jgi:DNA-binding MarR family transcriptional regulator